MGSKPAFHAVLDIPLRDPQAPKPGEELPGPDAGGPLQDGDKLHWIFVWIIQNGPEDDPWAAAAYGEFPEEEHGESSEGSAEESGPIEGTSWAIHTEMADPSDDFRKGPAIATAMARLERKNDSPEVYWWTVPVMLKKPETRAT